MIRESTRRWPVAGGTGGNFEICGSKRDMVGGIPLENPSDGNGNRDSHTVVGMAMASAGMGAVDCAIFLAAERTGFDPGSGFADCDGFCGRLSRRGGGPSGRGAVWLAGASAGGNDHRGSVDRFGDDQR